MDLRLQRLRNSVVRLHVINRTCRRGAGFFAIVALEVMEELSVFGNLRMAYLSVDSEIGPELSTGFT